MQAFEEYSYTIPAFMMCAIEYGELDGLSEDDEKALDAFLDSLPKGNRVLSFDVAEYPEFCTSNDILGHIGCDCVTATLTVFND